MRPSSVVLISLLALSLLLTGAQGIRFKIGLLSFGHEQPVKIHDLKKISSTAAMTETSNEGGSTVEDSITGMNRKLITTTTTSSSPTNAKINEKNGENNKTNPRSSSSSSSSKSKSSDHGESALGTHSSPSPSTTSKPNSDDEISHDHYHIDITDITEMDYSPARRKPPIHN